MSQEYREVMVRERSLSQEERDKLDAERFRTLMYLPNSDQIWHSVFSEEDKEGCDWTNEVLDKLIKQQKDS